MYKIKKHINLITTIFVLFFLLPNIIHSQIINYNKFDNKKMCNIMFKELQNHSKQLSLIKLYTNEYFEIKDTISCNNITTYQEISKKYINKWLDKNDINYISMTLLKDFDCKIKIKSKYNLKNNIHIITCLFTYN
jgi:hypothetical protein